MPRDIRFLFDADKIKREKERGGQRGEREREREGIGRRDRFFYYYNIVIRIDGDAILKSLIGPAIDILSKPVTVIIISYTKLKPGLLDK